jgi:predicted dehydrogenase
MTLRAAVIGCGFIGAGEAPWGGAQSHAAAWSRAEGVSLAAVCDTDPARLEAAMSRWGVSDGYRDAARLLREGAPDLVSLCTPDRTHGRLLAEVLASPGVRAVLAEKPLALRADEARALVALARARGVLLAVNYGRRALPSHQRLRDWLARGGIGRILALGGVYTGGLKHNGTHWIDLARFLAGDIVGVGGVGPAPEEEVDPTIDVRVEFVSGARGCLSGVADLPYSLFEMDLIGSAGRVRVADAGHRFEVTVAAQSQRFPGFRELIPAPGPAGGLEDLVGHAVGDLVRALQEARPPACTGEDAVVALEWAEAALRSARREGEPVARPAEATARCE